MRKNELNWKIFKCSNMINYIYLLLFGSIPWQAAELIGDLLGSESQSDGNPRVPSIRVGEIFFARFQLAPLLALLAGGLNEQRGAAHLMCYLKKISCFLLHLSNTRYNRKEFNA